MAGFVCQPGSVLLSTPTCPRQWVHPRECLKVNTEHWHIPVWASHPTFHFVLSGLTESVRRMARVVWLPPFKVIQRASLWNSCPDYSWKGFVTLREIYWRRQLAWQTYIYIYIYIYLHASLLFYQYSQKRNTFVLRLWAPEGASMLDFILPLKIKQRNKTKKR